jgi:hypothetical protein
MSDEVSQGSRELARYAAGVFGGKPEVSRFFADGNTSRHVDILVAQDAPLKGVRSYATLGLSEWPVYRNGVDFGVRIELVGACRAKHKHFDNALATAAFDIINSKQFCAPGVIFPDVLAMYKASKTMKHFFFVPPFLWGSKGPVLQRVEGGRRKVEWLMVVPISDAEAQFAQQEGPVKLEELFVREQIHVFDLERKSVV